MACIAKSKHLLKAFIGFNDNEKNFLKLKRAIKVLDRELEKLHKKAGEDSKDDSSNSETQSSILDEAASTINAFLEEKSTAGRPLLPARPSSNYSNFLANLPIIERMSEEGSYSLEDIARWLGMSKQNLRTCIFRNEKEQLKAEKVRARQQIKGERTQLIQEGIEDFMKAKTGS